MIRRNNSTRRLILDTAFISKRGHVPSSLSVVDILAVIYDQVMSAADVCILSKGHAALALYAQFQDMGWITVDALHSFGAYDSDLGGHPDSCKLPGVCASTGSLGHGLPIAVGMALADRTRSVYCIVGDGEMDEGSCDEALRMAVGYGLDNLIVVVDDNGSSVRKIDFPMRLLQMGFFVCNSHGHDRVSLRQALQVHPQDQPLAVVARTMKGYPFARMMSEPSAWHHRAPTEVEYNEMLLELDRA